MKWDAGAGDGVKADAGDGVKGDADASVGVGSDEQDWNVSMRPAAFMDGAIQTRQLLEGCAASMWEKLVDRVDAPDEVGPGPDPLESPPEKAQDVTQMGP